MIACLMWFTATSRGADVWPKGSDFPVGMFTVSYSVDMQRVAADGFNLINSYSFSAPYNYTPDEYVQMAAQFGLDVMMPIGLVPDNPGLNIPPATAASVQHFAQYDNIAWWYYTPEEPRYWIPSEMQPLQNAAAVIRANDPLDRPIYTYLQNGYTGAGLANYAPYLDGIGAGVYSNYAGKPRPWARWQIEQDIEAIRLNGNPPGQFPVAALQMFPHDSTLPMTGADAYHDAYLTLVTGAKAILIYGDAYRDQVDPGIYQSYKKVANELNGPGRLGEVFLFGNQIKALQPSILAGPTMSAAFTDSLIGGGNTIQYSSISHRAMAYDGNMYLATVNSAEQSVLASFPGIRTHGNSNVEVLFENRTVPVANRQFTDFFNPLGVHLYRLPSSADMIIVEEAFDSSSGWQANTPGASITTSNGIATLYRGSSSTGYMRRNLVAGNLTEGGFLELKVQADPGTEFYLELIAPNGGATSLINWRSGSGQMQTLIQAFDGNWRSTAALKLGIRGGNSYLVDSLGIYFKPLIAGDADADGDVDLSDLGALASLYGKASGAIWSDGDFDRDGDVDLNDLGSLASHYGAGQAQAMADFALIQSIPEPLSASLMCNFLLFNRVCYRRG